MGRKRTPARAGFTLLEMLIVLALLGAMLGLVLGAKPPRHQALSLRAATSAVAASLREARSTAIAADTPAAWTLDLAQHRYGVAGREPQSLPPLLQVTMLTTAAEAKPGVNSGVLRFFPDGSATGGRVTLSDGSRALAVGVDWLTGRISVAEVSP